MISVLSGAGFDKFTSGVKKLADSGVDINQLASLPNFPLMLSGAGIKDAANSLELVKPMIAQLMPPPPPQQEQQDPKKLSAAIQMMSARMGPGLQGIRPPAGGGPPMGF